MVGPTGTLGTGSWNKFAYLHKLDIQLVPDVREFPMQAEAIADQLVESVQLVTLKMKWNCLIFSMDLHPELTLFPLDLIFRIAHKSYFIQAAILLRSWRQSGQLKSWLQDGFTLTVWQPAAWGAMILEAIQNEIDNAKPHWRCQEDAATEGTAHSLHHSHMTNAVMKQKD